MSDPNSHADALLDEAVAAMGQMPAPDRPPDARVLEGLVRAKASRLNSISRTLYARIRHMHPAVRYGMVALVVSAVLLIGIGTRSETLLLADVVNAVAKHKTVRYEEKNESPVPPRRGGSQPEEQFNRNRPPRTLTHMVYVTLDNMHVRLENPNGQVSIFDAAKAIMLHFWPKEKRALVSKFLQQPRVGFLEIIDDLEKDKKTTSSIEKLDGSDVVVYRLTKEGTKSSIWADRQTNLPVRVEMEQIKGGRAQVLMTQFVWDPPIADPAQFFSVEPPPGYTVSRNDPFNDAPRRRKPGRP